MSVGADTVDAMQWAIEAIDLVKRFGDHTAVDGVSFAVPAGTVLGLLGPNGAGKTTLISIVCGIVNASSGTVLADGHDIRRDYRAARARIGLVPDGGASVMLTRAVGRVRAMEMMLSCHSRETLSP